MGMRLRAAMEDGDTSPFSGIVEADKTYIGGKVRGKGRGRGAYESKKTPVVTLIQRDGKSRTRTIQKVNRDNLATVLAENVHTSAVVMTDQNPSYISPGRAYAGHKTVDH